MYVSRMSIPKQTRIYLLSKFSKDKKQRRKERILEVENGTFTPLVFGTNGGMGKECGKFLKQLSEHLAIKSDESYAHTVTWLRTKLSFAIIKSVNVCVRGSRTPFRRSTQNVEIEDFALNASNAGL